MDGFIPGRPAQNEVTNSEWNNIFPCSIMSDGTESSYAHGNEIDPYRLALQQNVLLEAGLDERTYGTELSLADTISHRNDQVSNLLPSYQPANDYFEWQPQNPSSIDLDSFTISHPLVQDEPQLQCLSSDSQEKNKKSKMQSLEDERTEKCMAFWNAFKETSLDTIDTPEDLAEAIEQMDKRFISTKTVNKMMNEYLSNHKTPDFRERYDMRKQQIGDSKRNVKFYHRKMCKDEDWVERMEYYSKLLQVRYGIRFDQSIEQIALSTQELRGDVYSGKNYTRAIERMLFLSRGPDEAARWRRFCSG